jgi:hypothetical protein
MPQPLTLPILARLGGAVQLSGDEFRRARRRYRRLPRRAQGGGGDVEAEVSRLSGPLPPLFWRRDPERRR